MTTRKKHTPNFEPSPEVEIKLRKKWRDPAYSTVELANEHGISSEVLLRFAKRRGWADRQVRGHSLLVSRG